MGSMKQKRRKKLAKQWTEFQETHGLSEKCSKQACAIGDPPELLMKKLASLDFDEAMPIEHGRHPHGEGVRNESAIADEECSQFITALENSGQGLDS